MDQRWKDSKLWHLTANSAHANNKALLYATGEKTELCFSDALNFIYTNPIDLILVAIGFGQQDLIDTILAFNPYPRRMHDLLFEKSEQIYAYAVMAGNEKVQKYMEQEFPDILEETNVFDYFVKETEYQFMDEHPIMFERVLTTGCTISKKLVKKYTNDNMSKMYPRNALFMKNLAEKYPERIGCTIPFDNNALPVYLVWS